MARPELMLLLALQVLLLAGAALAASGLKTRLTSSQVDAIVNNERLFRPYLKCLLEDTNAHCMNQDSLELKRAIGPSLSTGCSKCTADQRLLTERVIRHLMTRRPRDWSRLKDKYDPTGEYERRYGSALNQPRRP